MFYETCIDVQIHINTFECTNNYSCIGNEHMHAQNKKCIGKHSFIMSKESTYFGH